jgi:predicted RNase H-like HicB family nuclease
LGYNSDMSYQVVLIENEEGVAVSCPALPGCWSQGATRKEALENIRTAIREYLDVKTEITKREAEEEGATVTVCEVELTPA